MDIIIAGDDVTHRKPAPDIYNLASTKLQIPSVNCLVIEDSLIGLQAAKAAENMPCFITYTKSTEKQNFAQYGADLVIPDLTHLNIEEILTFLQQPTEQERQEFIKSKFPKQIITTTTTTTNSDGEEITSTTTTTVVGKKKKHPLDDYSSYYIIEGSTWQKELELMQERMKNA
jgi:hypothetical protein